MQGYNQMENSDDKTLLRNNPFFVISIASLVAIIMFAISFLSYYNSETRKTIEQIQANNLNSEVDQQNDDVTPASLDADYIDSLEKSITDKVLSQDDDADFNPEELTDSALGL
jgi:cytoskeletal protein RodZ